MTVEKVVSGGQTGVDRAALDVALERGIACGGWCPRSRWSEAGPIDDRYPLVETPSADPAVRTAWNVRDSDATLIITEGDLTGGTALSRRVALELGRPCLVVSPTDPGAAERVAGWLRDRGIRTLNVAGPRETKAPGIHDRASTLLRAVLR